MQMMARDIVWLTLCALGPGSLLLLAARPPSDPTAATALRRSGLASIPALLPAIEYIIRVHVLHSFADGSYYVRWPLFLGCVCAIVFIVGSFLEAPLRELRFKWSLLRLMHLIAWASTLLLSIGM